MAESVSFDRAAECYDRTRVTDPVALEATIDLLERELGSRGRVLEVGVGTGALAIPLAGRGVPVLGIDVSPAMLTQLRAKRGGERVPVAVGDATRLPLGDGSHGGGYLRWVLHLIPAWGEAVAELCRVLGRGGVVVVDPGGYRGDWLEIWGRVRAELGAAVDPVGLDTDERGFADLDEAFVRHGAVPRELPSVRAASPSTLGAFFEQARARSYSWTWRVDPGTLGQALDRVEVWARERHGEDLDRVTGEIEMTWRAYDLP